MKIRKIYPGSLFHEAGNDIPIPKTAGHVLKVSPTADDSHEILCIICLLFFFQKEHNSKLSLGGALWVKF